MFFVYFYYTGVTYTTPYLKGALGASATLVLLIGTIRTYGITLFSGPVFGAIASKVGSPSRVITVGSVLAAVVLLGFVFLPQKPAIAVLAAVLVIFLGFVANGVFGIVSGQLTEGKVPLEVFGTASGLLSVVGFLPDTFSSTWFGKLMDQKGNAAYDDIFIILAISALIAGAIAVVLLWYVKKHKADEPLDEAVADAGIVEA